MPLTFPSRLLLFGESAVSFWSGESIGDKRNELITFSVVVSSVERHTILKHDCGIEVALHFVN